MYPETEVIKAALGYFNQDELAAGTWVSKYAMRNKEGELLEKSPEEMHRRMAREFARIERNYKFPSQSDSAFSRLSMYGKKRTALSEEKIYSYFHNFAYIIPQGSVMYSLGNPHIIASLSNCVVLPQIHDSYGGIFYTDQQLAQLFKRRCGVGIDLSSLRPEGVVVTNAALTTSGAVSFMERFSNTTREVAQNGRRGALMMTMDIAHPDIEKFITSKQDLAKITGANISVRISNEFMEAVEQNREYTLRWPIDAEIPKISKKTNARALWQQIVSCAHNTAEPGVIFWDKQHNYSTSSIYPGYKNVSTNPCSEIAMQGGDTCRLMAINLYSFVEEPFTPQARFRHQQFYETVYEAQRLMDDLVDLELEAIERIIEKVKLDPEPDYIKQTELKTWELLYTTGEKGRRTGLGFTALADALAALNCKFDSSEALAEIESMMRVKCTAEFDSSIDMAIERGAFKEFNPQIEEQSQFIQLLKKEFPDLHQRMMDNGRRNISISTVAPTGSISILSQTSSGIEPVFALEYIRRKKINPNGDNADYTDKLGDKWKEFTVHHHKLNEWMRINGKKEYSGSPYSGATAPDINWKQRLAIQALVQKYTTHSISSTINLPSGTEVETISNIYLEAWKMGLKGITVYRDNSRSGVLLNAQPPAEISERPSPERPQQLEASIMRFKNQSEDWIAFVGLMNHRPYEIFTGKAEEAFNLPLWVNKGWIVKEKSGRESRYDFHYQSNDGNKVCVQGLSRIFNQEYWNYAKLISGVLRQGMPLVQVTDLVEHLKLYPDTINTWKSGVERALRQFIPDGTKVNDKDCPACGDYDGLLYQEGCLKCKSCGYAECG